ncbi:DUF2238 domain-containing protein [Gallaecimonas mangrovi]|uniref:DUF2238 domain-containing protein n=1 Tax=Gallaecimonas mangrovi TaxID=2291597 RepID=UPI000E202CB1|nr:DUF2238 domain-containing protein [Gallaecimonas mangrovi]
MSQRVFAKGLAGLYAVLFIALSWSVAERTVWYAEVTPLVLVYLALLVSAPRFTFSNLSYLFVFIPLLWHLIGAHFTFAKVPFGWVMSVFELERNPYDRIGHFLVGLFTVPIMEVLIRKRLCGITVAALFAVFAIGTVAASYEIIEWLYAVKEGGEAGISFLGAQGDVWDAQKDMLADLLGALIGAGIGVIYFRRANAG